MINHVKALGRIGNLNSIKKLFIFALSSEIYLIHSMHLTEGI